MEIRSLKTELELYKKHCKQLEDVIANLTVMQNPKNYVQSAPSQNDYPSSLNSNNREMFVSTEPYFGKKVSDSHNEYRCSP